MPKKKPLTKDKSLKDFLKSGGRNNAESDFDMLLKKAVKPKKPKAKS
ncbi:hypothetical protein KC950_02790 [Candidatus Saccharibacteria bacterium]|nr:hypothetical protein [Candidatus Saccharibacteria bacterium]